MSPDKVLFMQNYSELFKLFERIWLTGHIIPQTAYVSVRAPGCVAC